MTLLLLRHGQAESRGSSVDQTDFSRALTEKGKQQASNAARLLGEAKMLPDLVLCSPLLRARQTAEAFTTAAEIPGPVSQSWLSSGMNPGTALAELVGFPEFEKVMLVGHEPDLSFLLQSAIGAVGSSVEIKKGCLACLEIHPPSPRGVLRFLIPFKLAKHMD